MSESHLTEIAASVTALAAAVGSIFGVQRLKKKKGAPEAAESPPKDRGPGARTVRLQTTLERLERQYAWLQAVSDRQDQLDLKIATLAGRVDAAEDNAHKLDGVLQDVAVLKDRTRRGDRND